MAKVIDEMDKFLATIDSRRNRKLKIWVNL